ncbi:MAG: M14 family zinc carboxypeptidase [Pseudomonadota bacterium]
MTRALVQRLVGSLALFLLAGYVGAQDAVDIDAEMYPTNVSYDAKIPTPEEFLGRPLGAAPVRHHEFVAYINRVAQLSDRLTAEVIGYSHERRPIQFVVATSAQNQARIDDIQAAHLGLSDPDVAEEVTADMPVITWLDYGVHGSESSGMDAALPTVYYLAAAQGASVDELLNSSVILVVGMFNPDGQAARIAWLDTFSSRVPNADPNHIEHNYDGRLARTNHYGFDLNRQWMSVTQPEPRAWMTKWHEWRPNVSVDFHEMGSEQTYYFAPGIARRTHPLIPDDGMQLISAVVAPSERFMDEQRRLYFHGDLFDHFFLGKGAGFPMINGGIGILHEASGARGIELETSNGVRTYRENILKQFRTGLGNATGAVEQRAELLNYQKRFYDEASDRARAHDIKAYIFHAPEDRMRLYHFVDLLTFHRIDVFELGQDFSQGGVTYRAGEALIVPLNQDQHTLVRTMFETMTEFEDSAFYDVSTWTYPLAFGLEHAAVSGRRLNNNLVGDAAEIAPPASEPFEEAPYAYAFEWNEYYAPRALYRVLDANLLARATLQPLTATTTQGVRELSRGTVIVSFDRQTSSAQEIHDVMRSIAAEDQVAVHSLTSGRSAIGTAGPDVGGAFFKPMSKPKVLIVIGREMDWYNAGSLWHLLDVRMNMPVTLKDRSRLADVNFSRYSHIVFAGGDYSSYEPEYLDRIRSWVNAGGTLIGTRQGAVWAKQEVLDYVEPEMAAGTPSLPDGLESGHDLFSDEELIDPDRFDYAEKRTREPLDLIGGAIFAGDLDTTHPLGFGYATRRIALHKNTVDILDRPQNPYATVISYDTPPLISGYASAENQSLLEGTAALIAERKGGGSVILFADHPNFRGIWYGTNKLFLNALFFSKAFDPLPEAE